MTYKRKEQIGDCTLYLGDAIGIMPTLESYEVIITDPVWPNCPAGLIEGHDRPYELFSDFCNVIPTDLRQLVIVMRNDCDPRFLSPVPRRLRFQQVAWCQYVMPGYLGRVLGGNETVYAFGEAVKSAPGRRVIPSLSPKAQPDDRPPNGHPCSRALVHAEWITKWFSDAGETILDPFMGSGTSGIAAVIEIDPKFFDIACRRIENTRRGEQIEMTTAGYDFSSFTNARWPKEKAILQSDRGV